MKTREVRPRPVAQENTTTLPIARGTTPAGGGDPSTDGDSRLDQLTRTGDSLMSRLLSEDSETFLRESRQRGGQ